MSHMIKSLFTNQYGEEWVFEYDTQLEKGTVKGSDVDWMVFPVIEGMPYKLAMNKEEQEWLMAAWKTATNERSGAGLYLGRDTDFRTGKSSCWLTNDYCPLCLSKRREFEIHHCIWSSDGGTYDFFNMLRICNSCHVVLTRGSVEDRFPKNKAAFYHQLMYFSSKLFPRENPKTGRHMHVSFLDQYKKLKEALLEHDKLSDAEKEHVDAQIRKDARIEYQYFRDMALGKWSWEEYENRILKPSLMRGSDEESSNDFA